MKTCIWEQMKDITITQISIRLVLGIYFLACHFTNSFGGATFYLILI